jgi:endoglucanase
MDIEDPDPHWQGRWDADRLRRNWIEPWQALAAEGVGVHVGEFAVGSSTPHAVALAWLRDALALWREAGWGWAIWDLYGPFGFLDSPRQLMAQHK